MASMASEVRPRSHSFDNRSSSIESTTSFFAADSQLSNFETEGGSSLAIVVFSSF